MSILICRNFYAITTALYKFAYNIFLGAEIPDYNFQSIIGLYGVDTRELTKIVREAGVMNAAITSKPVRNFEEIGKYSIKVF